MSFFRKANIVLIIILLLTILLIGCTNFNLQRYSIFVTIDGKGTCRKSPQKSTYKANSVVDLKANPEKGWEFSYWQGAGYEHNIENPIQLTVDNDIYIKAVFTEVGPIKTTIEGSGVVEKKEIDDKNQIELTANADTGWRFDHWEGDITGNKNPYIITADQEKNITAVFVRKNYTLQVETDGSGEVIEQVVYSPSSNHEYETEVKLTADPDSGWFFDHWEGDIKGSNNPLTITINSEKNVTAIFKQFSSVNGEVVIKNKTGDSITTTTLDSLNESDKETVRKIDNDRKYRKEEIIVKYKDVVSTNSINDIENNNNMNKKKELDINRGKAVLYSLSKKNSVKEKVKQLRKSDRVKWAEPNYIHYISSIPNDPDYSRQWGNIKTNLEAAWDVQTGSKEVKVAVIDSGIIPDHPDLEDNLLQGADFVGTSNSYDSPKNYVKTDNDPTDETLLSDGGSHGTHVAGILGAVANNNTGVSGVNWNTSILPVRAISSDGTGTNWDIAEGVYYAIDQGVDIINLSLGRSGDGEESSLEKEYLNVAENNNVLVFAAAGNGGADGIGDSVVNYPAQYEKSIAVGAVNKNSELAEYSNYGSNLDIVAPGGGAGGHIYSTWGYYENGNTISDYNYMAGTSMATPYASGMAALLISNGDNITNVKDHILNTTVDLGESGKDNMFGYGLIDAYGALLNKRLGIPYVFAGYEKEGSIHIESELKQIGENNGYSLNQVKPGTLYLYAWRDVNQNNKVDSGDYFGKSDSSIVIEEGTTKSNINIDMYYNAGQFSLDILN